MDETEDRGVEGLAAQSAGDGGDGWVPGRAAVDAIGEDGGLRALREVNADLVRAPRLEAAGDERGAAGGEHLVDGDVGDGAAAAIREGGELAARGAVARVQRVDAARRRPAERDGAIDPLDAVLLELRLEALARRVALRHDEDAAGVLVQAMHDAGAQMAHG